MTIFDLNREPLQKGDGVFVKGRTGKAKVAGFGKPGAGLVRIDVTAQGFSGIFWGEETMKGNFRCMDLIRENGKSK